MSSTLIWKSNFGSLDLIDNTLAPVWRSVNKDCASNAELYSPFHFQQFVPRKQPWVIWKIPTVEGKNEWHVIGAVSLCSGLSTILCLSCLFWEHVVVLKAWKMKKDFLTAWPDRNQCFFSVHIYKLISSLLSHCFCLRLIIYLQKNMGCACQVYTEA